MLHLLHGVFIHDIDDLGLIGILFGMLDDGNQSQHKPQKQEELDEIIRSAELDGLGARPYDADRIADAEKSGCDDP